MKYIIGLLIIAGLWACTKEDWPDNSRPEVNPFAVPADATGEEAELRRGFFDRTGMYLGEFYQFNLSSCIRQQNSLTAQFVSFSLSNLANIFYPPQFLQ